MNDSAFYLLEKFYEFKSSSYSQTSHFNNLDKLNKILKQKFGPYQRKLFEICKDLMENLFTEINNANKEAILDDIYAKYEIDENKSTKGNNRSSEKIFGENIKFYSFYENKILSDGIPNSDESDPEEVSFNKEKFFVRCGKCKTITELFWP